MPSRRVTRSVTAPIELAIGAGSPSWYSSAPFRVRRMRYWCAPRLNSSSTSTRERGGAPRRRMVSRLPRAAGMPYIAQAMASSRVVLPAPLGPMMPVRPAPSTSSVFSCWRKLAEPQPVDLHQAGQLALDAVHQLIAEPHERLAVELRGQRTSFEVASAPAPAASAGDRARRCRRPGGSRVGAGPDENAARPP